MDLKREETQNIMGRSPAEPVSPPPEIEIPKVEARQDENQGIDNCQLQTSLMAVVRQLQELAAVMGRTPLAQDPTTSLHKLRKNILKLSKFEYPETRTVGFIGNTGVGLLSIFVLLLSDKEKKNSFMNREKLCDQLNPRRIQSCALGTFRNPQMKENASLTNF